jgi:signal recognition particle subunit SRP68
MRASASFDRSRSSEALQQSCVARKLLGFLASHSANAKDEAFANSFIDAGDAQIRFSAYQLELGEQNLDVIEQGVADEETCEKWAPSSNALMKEIAAASGPEEASRDKSDNKLTWHGKTISVRNPELIEAIAHAEKERTALEEALQLSAKDGEKKEKRSKSAPNVTQSVVKEVLVGSRGQAQRRAWILSTEL